MTVENNDDVLEGLTDEERAALSEEDQDEQGAEESADDGAKSEGGDNETEEGGATDDGAAESEEQGDGASDGEEICPPTPSEALPLVAEPVDNAEEKLKAIADERAQLTEEFDDGEITAKEFQEKLADTNRREREIERAIDRHDLAQEMKKQKQANDWNDTVRDFLDEHDVFKKSERMFNIFDMEVRAVGSSEEAKNMTGKEILSRARQNLLDEGVIQDKKAEPPAQAARSKGLPPTMRDVPAAESISASEGKYAHLDRLMESDPLKYEEEVAKLSAEQVAEYLK